MVVTGSRGREGESFRLEHTGGKTLLAILREHGVYLDAPCGGRGICGACNVLVRKGVQEPSRKEMEHFSKKALKEGWRLACCVLPDGDCDIYLPEDGAREMEVETDFYQPKHTESQNPSGQNQKNISGKQENSRESRNAASGLPDGYGAAIDIGTTTLAAVLVNLRTGLISGTVTGVNHQRVFGADVVSRIQASNEGNGGALKKSICLDLEKLLEALELQAGIRTVQIERITIAGNTTMCHLLLGYSCKTLGAAPFEPVDLSLLKRTYRELFLSSRYQADVTILPGISAFVGADITAGIYSSKMAEQEEVSMLIDLGTNGEMVIGNCNGLLAGSAAAGPAFEGGNISCGVPGTGGAISHMTLSKEAVGRKVENSPLWIQYETIRKEAPIGLCGSGIIDLTCELIRHGLVDENGTLAEPWFTDGFPVTGGGITFTQADIREIQLAKSAIRAGVETLLAEVNRTPDELAHVYLAGGFGHGMNLVNAIEIGLLPKEFCGKMEVIGNSSLEGAICVLLEEKAEGRMVEIAALATEVNLAMNTKFNEWYLEQMFFDAQIMIDGGRLK